MWFLFKILYVKGRNMFLRKGEMCFILLEGVLTSLFLYFRSCDHFYTHYTYSLYMWMYVSFTYPYMCCFFSFFMHMFLYLYAIYYFCFTQRCLDEFCLKCFRNISCQSLLVINSLHAKFFKSLC